MDNSELRSLMLAAAREHAKAHIEKHRTNAEIILNRPVGVGEHGDVMESLEKELEQMAHYQDQLDILDEYFVK